MTSEPARARAALSDLALVTGPTSAMNLALSRSVTTGSSNGEGLCVRMLTTLGEDDPFVAVTRATLERLSPGARFERWDPEQPAEASAARRLWICRPFRAPEKRLAAEHPEAPITVFDEGLSSFADRPVDAAGRRDQAAFDEPSVPRWLIDRVDSLVFSVDFDASPLHFAHVPRLHAPRGAVIRALEGFALPEIEARGATLVVGTAFHLIRRYAATDERDHYLRLIAQLGAEGDPVIWAPHPRSAAAFSDHADWERAGARGRFLSPALAAGVPVEVLGLQGVVNRVVSLGSSAQLTFPDWFGVEAYVSLDARFDDLERHFPHVALVRDRLPPVRIDVG